MTSNNDFKNSGEFKIEDIRNTVSSQNSNNNYNNENPTKEGPINLIEFHKKNFSLNEEALKILRNIKDDIIIVSIVGKARTGKSYLMNLLLNNNNGFEVASSINSCTRGIWLWNTPKSKVTSPNTKIIFIDSEGTNSVDISTKTYDSKIFALIVLISSLFIYNSNGNIDEKSIGDLALAAHLGNSIASNSIKSRDTLISELAPKFIWVLRDFSLEKVDPVTGEEITSNQYLELCLRNKISGKNSYENNLIRENIIKYFKERECVTLTRPVDDEEDLKNLKKFKFSELKPNFRKEFLELKKKVYETSKVKRINNKNINGPILADLLIAFINSINSGIVPNINSAWDNIVFNDIENSYENARNFFNKNQNENVKNLFELKFNVLKNFNHVLFKNKEIFNNIQYKNKFNEYKNLLSKEIDQKINSKIKKINSQNFKNFQNFINEKKNQIEQNLFNEKYLPTNKYSDYFNDYLNFLKQIKTFDNKNAEINNFIIKNDLNNTKDIFLYILSKNKTELMKSNSEIEKKYQQNLLEIKNPEQIKETTKSLKRKIELINNDLNRKENEINQLVNKYKILMNKRESNDIERNNLLMKNFYRASKYKIKNGQKILLENEEKTFKCGYANECQIF